MASSVSGVASVYVVPASKAPATEQSTVVEPKSGCSGSSAVYSQLE